MTFKRRSPTRRAKKLFYLVCEGSRTEPDYFTALQRVVDRSLIRIEIEGGAGTPDAIAKRAIELAESRNLIGKRRKKLSSFEERDEVWAIFDRDDHHHYDVAVQRCESAGVFVGRSNPCFEVWLILHIEDWQKPDGRDVVQAKLETILKGYNAKKRKSADFTEIIKSIESAEKRAEAQCGRREKERDRFGAPCTTIYELTRKIRLSDPSDV